MKLFPILAAVCCAGSSAFSAVDPAGAAHAVNQLGVDLYRQQSGSAGNFLLSPFSIQSALAMTYAGAAGETRAEMARVLHYPREPEATHESFAALSQALTQAVEAVNAGGRGKIEFNLANRLYGQRGYAFRPAFLALVRERYRAPLEEVDFRTQTEPARRQINQWVEGETHNRIRELITPGVLDTSTRLVLVNALYLRAPWDKAFDERATQPAPFHFADGRTAEVPTMQKQTRVGLAQRDGFRLVSLPYLGGELQLLLLVPEQTSGLPALERRLDAALLQEAARLPATEAQLHLPRFRLEPPTLPLASALQTLGMKTAFDVPPGSANFDGMAPRQPNDYLAISAVLHKTFLALDEKGTEAAAATAVVMMTRSLALRPTPPVEIRIDRPFLFAIQHRSTGACLFLGRLVDPR